MRTGYGTDDPPHSPRRPRPIPHQLSGRQCRVRRHRCHYLSSHAYRPEAFQQVDRPSGAHLLTQSASLHGRAGTLWLTRYQEVSPDSLGTLAVAQCDFSRQAAQTRTDALLEPFDARTTEGRSARLLSCACRSASAWLDTLSLIKALELKSGEVRTGLRHHLGNSMLPSNTPAVQCDCGAPLRPTDVDHGTWYLSLAAHNTLCHDILKRTLLRVVHRPGIASTQEPALRRLHGLAVGSGTFASGASTWVEAWGDILLALPGAYNQTDFAGKLVHASDENR
jgi:hypothetical protein